MRSALAFALALGASGLSAQDHTAIAERAVAEHVLPGYSALSAATATLEETAAAFCSGDEPRSGLDTAFHAAFDAWMGVSHLRFGPSESEDRAFAIAFWPDTRGFTPRQIESMIRDESPVVDDPAAFAEISIAARGLFALDFLLFDPERGGAEPATYRCRLLMAIATDLARNAAAIEGDWTTGFTDVFFETGPDNPIYATPEDVTRTIFGALATGLEATIELRLGRPLGTFERPRPKRAEAWRSGRPLRNVALSIAALQDLAEAAFLPEIGHAEASDLRQTFERAAVVAERAPTPMTEAVTSPVNRIKVEAVQTAMRELRAAISDDIGATLGVTLGFNALDGD